MPDVAETPRPFSCSRTFIVDRGVDCLLLRSFEKCLTAFAGPCSAAYFPICALTSDVYSLYLPRPLLSPSNACFTSALVLSSSFSEREGTFAGSVGTLLKYLNSAISESLRTLDLQSPPTEDLNDITQKYWRILIWRFARKSAKPPN